MRKQVEEQDNELFIFPLENFVLQPVSLAIDQF